MYLVLSYSCKWSVKEQDLTSSYLVIYSYIYTLTVCFSRCKENTPFLYKAHILMFVGWLNSSTPLKMVSGFVGKSRFKVESFKTQQIPLWVLPTLDAYHVRGWITLRQYHYSSLINSLPVHHGPQILDTQSKEGLIILKVTRFLWGLKNEKSAHYFSYIQDQKKSWKKKEYSNIISLWLPSLFMTPLYKPHKSFPATYRYSKWQNKIEHEYRKHHAFIMHK